MMEKFGSGIRNKHPGSATLANFLAPGSGSAFTIRNRFRIQINADPDTQTWILHRKQTFQKFQLMPVSNS